MTDNTLQSGSNEWYTPERYIELARLVLGRIDIDPASCATANKAVKALEFFSDRGLDREWSTALNWQKPAGVFLNPPYGRIKGQKSGAWAWVEKLTEEFNAGRVREAILLVNSSTGDQWFQKLWARPICFVDHRIRFDSANGKTQPTKSNVFVYFGENQHLFAHHFSEIGKVWMP